MPGSPSCMSQHEWQDLVVVGQTWGIVEGIADFPGVHGPVQDHRYAWDWVACEGWKPGKSCRGWFDNVHDVLLSKTIVDT